MTGRETLASKGLSRRDLIVLGLATLGAIMGGGFLFPKEKVVDLPEETPRPTPTSTAQPTGQAREAGK